MHPNCLAKLGLRTQEAFCFVLTIKSLCESWVSLILAPNENKTRHSLWPRRQRGQLPPSGHTVHPHVALSQRPSSQPHQPLGLPPGQEQGCPGFSLQPWPGHMGPGQPWQWHPHGPGPRLPSPHLRGVWPCSRSGRGGHQGHRGSCQAREGQPTSGLAGTLGREGQPLGGTAHGATRQSRMGLGILISRTLLIS